MLGTGVIVVYQESYSRQALGAGFLDGIVNQGCGYALAAENPGFTIQQLLREADIAMYASKAEYYSQDGHNRRRYRK